jgi:hypothetical protein
MIKCRGSGSGSSGYYLIDLGLPFQDHFCAGKALGGFSGAKGLSRIVSYSKLLPDLTTVLADIMFNRTLNYRAHPHKGSRTASSSSIIAVPGIVTTAQRPQHQWEGRKVPV